MTKRVILTGGTGFIGRHCLPLLVKRGYDVHAISSAVPATPPAEATWHQVDLFDTAAVNAAVQAIRPTHLLHLAWYVVPGKLAEAPENFAWLESSLELARRFRECGGRRMVVTGSGFEYDWNYGYCSEFLTPRAPATFYGICKNALGVALEEYADRHQLSSSWARIFFLYGPHEHPARLVPSVIRPLLRGEPARCSDGMQIRDYLHVEDAADALVSLLDSEMTGPVNIASGRPVRLKDLILGIARRLGGEELVALGAIPARPNDTPLVVADVARLSQELGWRPSYRLDDGLEQTIDWWKDRVVAS